MTLAVFASNTGGTPPRMLEAWFLHLLKLPLGVCGTDDALLRLLFRVERLLLEPCELRLLFERLLLEPRELLRLGEMRVSLERRRGIVDTVCRSVWLCCTSWSVHGAHAFLNTVVNHALTIKAFSAFSNGA